MCIRDRDKSHYEEREKRYLDTINKYEKSQQHIFPELYADAVSYTHLDVYKRQIQETDILESISVKKAVAAEPMVEKEVVVEQEPEEPPAPSVTQEEIELIALCVMAEMCIRDRDFIPHE